MRFLFACLCALLVSQATCMTNREFAEVMLESTEKSEVEQFYPGDEEFDDPDEEAIMLPGGPDDEVDIENLMVQTGLAKNMISNLNSLSQFEPERKSLGWWRIIRHVVRHVVRIFHHRRRNGGHVKKFHSYSRRSGSSDCIQHSFMVNLVSKKIRFPLNACAHVTYLGEVGVEMGLTLNGLEMFLKRISARNLPGLCDGLSGVKPINKVCLELYDVNIHSKSFCLSLEGRLNILFKRFHVHVAIGCYQLEGLNEKELTHMMNNTTALADYLSNTDNPSIERSGDLFQAGIKTLPELMQYVDITEIPDDDVTGDVEDAGEFVDQM